MDDDSLLSPREQEIATLIGSGMSNKEIAQRLGIRHQTVRNMLTRVFRKTHTCRRTQLAVKMILAECRPIVAGRSVRNTS